MTHRTRIVLDPELMKRARKCAAELGISLAEYVRRLVARDVGESRQAADPSIVFDPGDSGGCAVARAEDAMVAEAIAGRRSPDEGDR